MLVSSYRYSIDAILILKDENIVLQPESIVAITIDSSFDTYNRPIIYLSYNIQSRIYDKLVAQCETASINLRIRKKTTSNGAIGKKYIHDNFSYIIKTDPDYYRGLKEKQRIETDEDEYVRGVIALFKKSNINEIKRLHCDIIKNTTMASIIHKYTKHKKMVIAPLQAINPIDTIIIPPMESVTELISFLNEYDALYTRKYKYFEDFDVTYLLDGSGTPVHGTDEYDTIIINVVEPDQEVSKHPGIFVDEQSRSYLLYVDAPTTTMNIDIAENVEYNSIIGVSSTGEIKKVSLNNDIDGKGDRPLIQRIYNDNERMIENLKHEMDSTSIIFQFNKTEVDGSLFTPNKEYMIRNYSTFKIYDGRFMISFKKEVMVREGVDYIPSIVVGLRKILE